MITVKPTETRFVDLRHEAWGLDWAIQLPEAARCSSGSILTWPALHPEWKKITSNSWHYEWRTTPEYVRSQEDFGHKDDKGNVIACDFVLGMALRSEIESRESEVALRLSFTNESDRCFDTVSSEGGCLQARNEEFAGEGEVERCFVLGDGRAVCMKDLHRTRPIRCRYCTDPADIETARNSSYEWFWGWSSEVLSSPVCVGMASRDGSRAIAFGYEDSRAASQNADNHHCLHSHPFFGEIAPGETTTRRGLILFGEDLEPLLINLNARLQENAPA
jgi:hypothetical protein